MHEVEVLGEGQDKVLCKESVGGGGFGLVIVPCSGQELVLIVLSFELGSSYDMGIYLVAGGDRHASIENVFMVV